jgi:hypothetical protein
MADGLNRTVHSRVAKTSDIEIHVSTLVTDNGTFTEVREYVKSLDQYGRGLTFPATDAILLALELGLAESRDRVTEPVS